MIHNKRQAILENLIYLIIWKTLFIAPALDFKYGSDTAAVWNDVFRSWKLLLPFLVLFLVNNYLLIPYFLLRKKSGIYFLFLVMLMGAVFLMQPFPAWRFMQHSRQESKHSGQPFEPKHMARQPFHQHGFLPFPQDSAVFKQPKSGTGMRKNPVRRFPAFFFMSPLFRFLIIAALIVGLNVAIKLMFRLIREEQRVKELERQKLQSELDYLKHQINPHFFMNTLNNIHALIDIDAAKAKVTVLDLSKMMRYVLYDTEQATLPLEKELCFLTNYVDLMKLRYTDRVEIRLLFPENIPDVKVPPLLFLPFLENAFKHGVSYRHRSFIHCSVRVTGNRLECEIANSRFDDGNMRSENGIGLENVRKRLRLLYNDSYTLEINDEKELFKTLLTIPV